MNYLYVLDFGFYCLILLPGSYLRSYHWIQSQKYIIINELNLIFSKHQIMDNY